MPYTKKNGDGKRQIDWSKIWESLIGGLLLVGVIGALNWFLVVHDLKTDMKNLKKDFDQQISYVFTQNSMIGKTIWHHIHPNEPCPWPEIDFPKDKNGGKE